MAAEDVDGKVTKIRHEVRRVMMMDDDNADSFAAKGTFRPEDNMAHYGCMVALGNRRRHFSDSSEL